MGAVPTHRVLIRAVQASTVLLVVSVLAPLLFFPLAAIPYAPSRWYRW